MILTQGTVFSGLRSKKYPDVRCYGIVITARCDLFNSKVDKIFYLSALPYEKWLVSKVGAYITLKKFLNELEGNLNKGLGNYGFQWEILKTYSLKEFELTILSTESGVKSDDQKKLKKQFEEYNHLILSIEEGRIREALNEKIHKIKKDVKNFISGGNTQFTFLPKKAFDKEVIINDLVVDHQELDYMTLDELRAIVDCEIDIKNESLATDMKDSLDKKFFLKDDPGYSMVEATMQSPWVEYLLQRFANTFIRVGVDLSPDDKDIEKMLTIWLGGND